MPTQDMLEIIHYGRCFSVDRRGEWGSCEGEEKMAATV